MERGNVSTQEHHERLKHLLSVFQNAAALLCQPANMPTLLKHNLPCALTRQPSSPLTQGSLLCFLPLHAQPLTTAVKLEISAFLLYALPRFNPLRCTVIWKLRKARDKKNIPTTPSNFVQMAPTSTLFPLCDSGPNRGCA